MIHYQISVKVKKLGSYETVDKSKEREKINAFLEKKDFVDFGVSKKKLKNSARSNLKFDKDGKFVRRK